LKIKASVHIRRKRCNNGDYFAVYTKEVVIGNGVEEFKDHLREH
jgi:hypothetical protein